jgi:hypothetical protein
MWAGDAKVWREGDRRRETAAGLKSASAKSLFVNGRSQVGAASTCHLDDAEKRQSGRQCKRAVGENQSSVTERSRHWGKAAAPNERRHHLVKFEVKPVVYRQVRCM